MFGVYENNKIRKMPSLVKWVGGKNLLFKVLRKNIPLEFNTYYEPFFGGGTLFWNLKNEGKISRAIISDVDRSLINLLTTVKENPHDLAAEVANFQDLGDKENYYLIRSEFNSLISSNIDPVRQAAMFIYLNRNCFNGLWRTNRRGEFNVPHGGYKKYHIPSEEEILFYYKMLEGTQILLGDYKFILNRVQGGDFVYLDPPYVRTRKTQFSQYSFKTFDDSSIDQLYDVISALDRQGAYFLLTNRYCEEISEKFEKFGQKIAVNSWAVNSNGANRKGNLEILIRNF